MLTRADVQGCRCAGMIPGINERPTASEEERRVSSPRWVMKEEKKEDKKEDGIPATGADFPATAALFLDCSRTKQRLRIKECCIRVGIFGKTAAGSVS